MEGTFIDGKYEIIRQLGQGGMGTVYEARHRSTGKKVAVKVIVPAALAIGVDIVTRFEREARASGSIDSPFVVQVFDAGVDGSTGAPYMAMECLSGEDLQAAVVRLGPLPPEVVLRITAHACHGLQKAHEAGIVHRDIKSANLFLARRDDDSGELITKILDFGIAKVRANPLPGEDHKLTKTGSMLGSPVYMSPEQAVGSKDLDARSDIFSLGVMMYEALSGATPNGHLENLGALLMAICAQPTQQIQERAPWVSAEVAAIVHKALAIHPADRYQSAAELRAAVITLLPGGATTLTNGMVTALSPELKQHRANRLPVPSSPISFADTVLPGAESGPTAPTSSPDLVVARGATNTGMSTTAGLGSEIPPPPGVARPFRMSVGRVAALASFAIALGGGVYLVQHRTQATQATPERPVGLTAQAPSAPALAVSSPDAARAEHVTVAPADATVEVDGKAALVIGGRFELSGAIGSLHVVRVRLNGAEKRVDVVIAATGPIPAHVELEPKNVAAGASTASPASALQPRQTGQTGVGAKPAVPRGALSSAPAAGVAPAAPARPANQAPLDRNFGE